MAHVLLVSAWWLICYLESCCKLWFCFFMNNYEWHEPQNDPVSFATIMFQNSSLRRVENAFYFLFCQCNTINKWILKSCTQNVFSLLDIKFVNCRKEDNKGCVIESNYQYYCFRFNSSKKVLKSIIYCIVSLGSSKTYPSLSARVTYCAIGWNYIQIKII